MSWMAMQKAWRAPTHPGGVIAGPRYFNKDQKLQSYLWEGSRVISDKIGYGVTVAGSTSYNNLVSYNGKCGFTGGSYNVWCDPVYGWVASTLAIGSALLEYWQYTDPTDTSQGGSYQGDAFYTLGSGTSSGSFPALGATPTAYGRGSLRGTTEGGTSSTTLAVATTWQYWTAPSSSQPYGAYAANGTASGSKYFGSPQWKNGDDVYARSASKDSTGHYSYGSIKWNSTAGKFILGSYGSSSGWNEAESDPKAGESWTLSFAYSEDASEVPDGEDIDLSWNDYVLGSEKETAYIFRVAKWRAKA